jgi:hypothetical protein
MINVYILRSMKCFVIYMLWALNFEMKCVEFPVTQIHNFQILIYDMATRTVEWKY